MSEQTFGGIIHTMKNTGSGSRMPSQVYFLPTKFIWPEYAEWGSGSPENYEMIDRLCHDKGRNKIVKKLVRKFASKKKISMVLTERVWHAKQLFDYFKSKGLVVGLVIGDQKSRKRKSIPELSDEQFESLKMFDADSELDRIEELSSHRKIDVIIGTQKGDVGLSIETVDRLFIFTPSTPRRFNQQKGRAERGHTKNILKRFGKKDKPWTILLYDVRMPRLKQKADLLKDHFKNIKPFKSRSQKK